MLSCALARTVRLRPIPRPAPLRALATNPFVPRDDELTRLLDGKGGGATNNTSTVWGAGTTASPPRFPDNDADADADLLNPPTAPAGSLPPGSAPAPRSKSRAIEAHSLPLTQIYHLHVLATRNNTILTFTDPSCHTRAWVSAGLCGFKKVQRSGYEAGYQCAVRMFARIAQAIAESPSPLQLEIAFNGFGQGREAVYRALMASEGDNIRDAVCRLKDTTPIKIGGTKARKMRRL